MIVLNDMVADARVLKEADSLTKAGAEVVILSLWESGLPRTERTSRFIIRRVEIHTRRLPRWFPIRIFLVLFEIWIRFIWISYKLKADVYHSHDVLPLPVAYIAALLNQAKVIYDSHELETDRSNVDFFSQKLLIVLERVFMPKVDDLIISDGRARAEAMFEFHQYKRSYHVIRNYPYYQKIDTKKARIFNTLLSIKPNSDVIIYIGRRFKGRGLEKAIKALGSLPEGVVFVLLGQSNELYEAQLKEIAREVGVSSQIFFLPPVKPDEIIKYVSGAKVSLVLVQNTSLSYFLSTPSKLYESLAAGVPVVASNFPEIERVVHENNVGQVGITVDPENVKEITSALKRLLVDKKFWENCRSNALDLAKSKIDWKKEAQKLIYLYKNHMS